MHRKRLHVGRVCMSSRKVDAVTSAGSCKCGYVHTVLEVSFANVATTWSHVAVDCDHPPQDLFKWERENRIADMEWVLVECVLCGAEHVCWSSERGASATVLQTPDGFRLALVDCISLSSSPCATVALGALPRPPLLQDFWDR